MAKYLYGASIQGIQEFIFKTNKLQEIVGASEIVKNVAKEFSKNYKPSEILINAAGNIKAVFDTRQECEKVVLEFGKIIQQSAYGISISQAVVEFDGEAKEFINKLETKLKIQRNKPSIPLDMSLNISKLNPSTAKPLINKDNDIATKQKLEAYKSIEKDEKYKELKQISNSKNKIAVIHIDGNGLGQLIPNLKKQFGLELSEFSLKLDEATQKAFNEAKKDKKVREIILGGDDVTVICDANDAIRFTREFLENFEKETEKSFTKLTACAGIAYCNEKYPFHYAVDLAEGLCGVAKDKSNRESSCMMFHNIQSSSFQSWEKIVKNELTITNDKETIKCDFGPYYLGDEDKANIEDFVIVYESLRLKDSPSSKLRSWLSELYKSDINAKNFLDRLNTMTANSSSYNIDILNKNLKNLDKELQFDNLIIDSKTPIYDILQILSITTSFKGDTNNDS
ncbi:MAG: hypothetical protein U9N30_07470 [Campylobacterota bacterium]|nr:hypothetical protein [Campylobacterota bacterium]